MAFTFEQRWERARRRSRCFSVWQRRAAQRVTERIGRALERKGYWYETRLKRVFAIDIETCRRCGGRLKVIASIEETEVIERILAHLDRAEPAATAFAPRVSPPSALI